MQAIFFPEPTPVENALDQLQMKGYRHFRIDGQTGGFSSIQILQQGWEYIEKQLKEAGNNYLEKTVVVANVFAVRKNWRMSAAIPELLIFVPEDCPRLERPKRSTKER